MFLAVQVKAEMFERLLNVLMAIVKGNFKQLESCEILFAMSKV